MSSKLSLSGIALNLNTLLDIIGKAEPLVLALPAFADLLSAAISVFSHEDKQKVIEAYEARKNQTDADHAETQKELEEVAATVPGSEDADTSPKGGAM